MLSFSLRKIRYHSFMTLSFSDDKSSHRIKELYKEEAEQLAQALSQKYDLPYIDLSRLSINTDALKIVPEAIARESLFAPFEIKGRKVEAATSSPEHPKLHELLEELKNKGFLITLFIASKTSLDRVFERYAEVSGSLKAEAGLIDVSEEQLSHFLETVKTMDELVQTVNRTITEGKANSASKILEIVLAGAISIGASDIHFEPEEVDTRLRFRLDGVLQDITSFKVSVYKLILARIKLISGLKLNTKASSQDGRFTIKINKKEDFHASEEPEEVEIEIRTSIIPGTYGESIVLRILDPKAISVPLNAMGIEPYLLSVFEHEIEKPNGLILVTGPTGSGKTTTLYAFLRKVNEPGTKIITIEDPVEYHLKGVSQTQVNDEKGYTFLEGLRSALRQDPDIIMVGEIRDKETAEIAINSALTGHLVFSTLHTNTAAGAIPRLIDLSVNPKIIGSAISLVIAQRLIRKLCDACKEMAEISAETRTILEHYVATIKTKGTVAIPEIPGTLPKPKGCPSCNMTGYKGRSGVYEAIKIDDAVAKLIPENPSDRDIRKVADAQGILTMQEDGIVKVLRGITDITELRRVVELDTK